MNISFTWHPSLMYLGSITLELDEDQVQKLNQDQFQILWAWPNTYHSIEKHFTRHLTCNKQNH